MQKLLMPAAEVLAMDATDFSCGDRLLKGINGIQTGENVSKRWPSCAQAFFVLHCYLLSTCSYNAALAYDRWVACWC